MAKVLIVDDEKAIRELIIDSCFADDEHVAIQAVNGKEAQDIIQNANPPVNIVITDHDMPEINGTVLINWIKKFHPEILVILITGGGTRHPFAHDHVTKPFRIAEIAQSIQNILDLLRQKPTS